MATTLYGVLSKSLNRLGFNRTESEQTKAIHRSWWKGPRFTMLGLMEVLATDGYQVRLFITRGDSAIIGVGWEITKDSADDRRNPDWCLTIFRDNEAGRLEARGVDTGDTQ